MKDPADAFTIELPLLGIVALPDWIRPAAAARPIEAAAFDLRLLELHRLPCGASVPAFFAAYDAMLDARERLYDAWLGQELDGEADEA